MAAPKMNCRLHLPKFSSFFVFRLNREERIQNIKKGEGDIFFYKNIFFEVVEDSGTESDDEVEVEVEAAVDAEIDSE